MVKIGIKATTWNMKDAKQGEKRVEGGAHHNCGQDEEEDGH